MSKVNEPIRQEQLREAMSSQTPLVDFTLLKAKKIEEIKKQRSDFLQSRI